MPPQSLSVAPSPVPGLSHQPWSGTRPGRKPGPSSPLPTLPRSAQTASLTQIFPEAQGALPSALDCALMSSSLVLHQPGASGPPVRWIGGKKLLNGWWKNGWA